MKSLAKSFRKHWWRSIGVVNEIDKYVYPGSTVLINKFHCRDADRLREIETLSTGANLAYLQLHPIRGAFDFNHLKEIHRFIFQDLFDWAGQIRTIDIGKNNLFCRTQFIESYAKSIFADFFPSCDAVKNDRDQFISLFSKYYSDLNALHPFREGNGRAQREFARELCLKCGFVFDLTQTTHEEMMEASIQSFHTGDIAKFVLIFQKCIIPIAEYRDYQAKLTSVLLILSADDL